VVKVTALGGFDKVVFVHNDELTGVTKTHRQYDHVDRDRSK